ncbi:PX domain protein [Ichthyophthirius multifiliis]|uniref:PX domain protein n=1 Tax=Ichthyophthirius multifiliis TaxID=5932 RepID=G0QJC3_ICHMU|nr:PX domain protein [Ichthyophthirius multifiliis]EGR34686.1 PX domain protein [Ichthyophthirius multifiliis]|eukprot:XP_004039990.1 PX domain protein [Ichthyophthirius multifiliis]
MAWMLRSFYTCKRDGFYIYSLNYKKQKKNSTSQNVVENRARFLNSFCNQVSKLKHLYYSDEFQLFLRSKDCDVSKVLNIFIYIFLKILQKALQNMKKYSVIDIIDKYQIQFPNFINVNILLSFLIITIHSLSRKNLSKNQILKLELSLCFQVKPKDLNDNFDQLNSNLLPEYEKCLISEYVAYDNNALIFQNQFNTHIFKSQEEIVVFLLNIYNQLFQIYQKNSKTKNSFQHFYDMVKFELRDAEVQLFYLLLFLQQKQAFIELINQKEEYEKNRISLQKDLKSDEEDFSKLIQGKKTIKAMFSSVDEQRKKLELQIEQGHNESKNFDILIDIITNIIGEIEIERFKNEKKTIYKQVLQCVSESEIINSNDMMNYWGTVNDISRKLQN